MKVSDLIKLLEKKCRQENEIEISLDTSTDTNDESKFGNRIFGNVLEVITNTEPVTSILVEMTHKNY